MNLSRILMTLRYSKMSSFRVCVSCFRKVQFSTTKSAANVRNIGRLLRRELRRQGTAENRYVNYSQDCVSPIRGFSSSSLYTPPAEGEQVPFVLKPDIDFDTVLRHQEQFSASVQARGMSGIDIPQLVMLWKEICRLEDHKHQLELDRKQINERAKTLSKEKGNRHEEKESIQHEGRRLREALKATNAELNGLLDKLYPLALLLPNLLHPEVPVGDDDKVLETVGETLYDRSSPGLREHPSISTNHPLVHAGCAYTQGDLALKELELLSSVTSHLNSRGFTQFSLPDMYKPIAIEALGIDINSFKETYAIETSENIMHLAGTSPLGFLAYYMMTVIEASDLPQRCFAVGRHYNASAESSTFEGLHRQYQDSRVEFFGVCEGSDIASNALMTQYLQILRDLFSTYDIPYRVVEKSSTKLLPAMQRMVAVELWVPSAESYVEVANVCSCTDFISRRLKVRYPANPKDRAAQSRNRSFAHTIHGTALKSSVLLSSLSDHHQIFDYQHQFA